MPMIEKCGEARSWTARSCVPKNWQTTRPSTKFDPAVDTSSRMSGIMVLTNRALKISLSYETASVSLYTSFRMCVATVLEGKHPLCDRRPLWEATKLRHITLLVSMLAVLGC